MSKAKVNKIPSKMTPTLIVVLFASMLLMGYLFINQQVQPVDSHDKKYIQIRIPENSSARNVAAILKNNDLIHSETAFVNYCRQNHLDSKLKAGLYSLSRSQSLKEIALQMTQGKALGNSFTIPEGYTVKQIGELLISKKICSQEDWNKALQADYPYDFIKGLPKDEHRLEGFLFPDTYNIAEHTNATKLIEMMLGNFAARWNKNFAEQARTKKMSVRETITIASLIEKEAQIAGERKRISGVIQNRLRKGIQLEICSTVLYSLGIHKDVLSYQDLEVNSPYNTYRHVGLPPGPIASPGTASIEASLNPEVHSYYFFVAKGDGSHYFSKTYSEHLNAQKTYGL